MIFRGCFFRDRPLFAQSMHLPNRTCRPQETAASQLVQRPTLELCIKALKEVSHDSENASSSTPLLGEN